MQAFRLVTRSSRLALWQANRVASQLRSLDFPVDIQPLKSTGDLDLVSPIYEMGVQGVFTRELDVALLSGDADVAVHSLKDIPIVPAKGLVIAAVLERGSSGDTLIYKDAAPSHDTSFVVATSSIRRRSQWLERFPSHVAENIRGNVETRLAKLETMPFDGVIMAQAAIDRLELRPAHSVSLDWMLPAPGQGAIAVVCRASDHMTLEAVRRLNDASTMQLVTAEREFLHYLRGGCSAPISALATHGGPRNSHVMNFKGAVHSLDGRQSFSFTKVFSNNDLEQAGWLAAQHVLESEAGRRILEEIFRARPGLRE